MHEYNEWPALALPTSLVLEPPQTLFRAAQTMCVCEIGV